MLASAESFIGSVWFGLMLFAVGYIGGHLFPISFFKKLIGKD